MEQVLKTGQLEDAQIAGLIAKRRVFPCFFGAAPQVQGVDELLSALQRYTVAPSYPAEFSAQVYKIARGEKDERLTFLKVTGGCLRVKQALRAEDWEEKADQLRLYSGNKYTLLQQARAAVIPQPLPQLAQLVRVAGGKGGGVRQFGHKTLVIGQRRRDAGLLEHDLADPDMICRRLLPERQEPSIQFKPLDQRFADRPH